MTKTLHENSILVIDFGSQVTQLIARRVRELGVYCEIHPFQNISTDTIRSINPSGVILSGGPASVNETETPRAPESLFNSDLGLPVLGICYGEQTMVQQMGGHVTASDHQEFGRAMIEIINDCKVIVQGNKVRAAVPSSRRRRAGGPRGVAPAALRGTAARPGRRSAALPTGRRALSSTLDSSSARCVAVSRRWDSLNAALSSATAAALARLQVAFLRRRAAAERLAEYFGESAGRPGACAPSAP